jgi:hypothetical protein
MINNLGGGYCDQLSQAVNTFVQGVFIFPARTIPFTEVASKALDIKATKLLYNHGNRARHSKIVGAFVAAKHGGSVTDSWEERTAGRNCACTELTCNYVYR